MKKDLEVNKTKVQQNEKRSTDANECSAADHEREMKKEKKISGAASGGDERRGKHTK